MSNSFMESIIRRLGKYSSAVEEKLRIPGALPEDIRDLAEEFLEYVEHVSAIKYSKRNFYHMPGDTAYTMWPCFLKEISDCCHGTFSAKKGPDSGTFI